MEEALKRALDIAVSLVGLVLLLPLLLVLGLVVAWNLGWPVLFWQERPGRGGKLFRLVKFRTMNDACGPNGELLPDDQRLTRFGRALRATSLDELPELWNVLRGDMSLVGPRPLLPEYLPLYSGEQRRRHDVRPGITGWAQINGRNGLSWEEKFGMDAWYIDNLSLWLDLKILAVTLWRVIRREGINAGGEATMPRFVGTGSRPESGGNP